MSFEVVKKIREFADCESGTIGRDVLRRQLHTFADKIDDTIDSIINHYNHRIAKQAGVMAETADRNVALKHRLKVAELALRNLQSRLVASVHDGTIDPYESLKITEDAIKELGT